MTTSPVLDAGPSLVATAGVNNPTALWRSPSGDRSRDSRAAVGRTRTLATRDVGTPVALSRVADALADAGPGAIVLGVVPFDPPGPGQDAGGLRLYREVGRSSGTRSTRPEPGGPGPTLARPPRSTPTAEGYRAAVATAVSRLREHGDPLQKVVLGRLLDLVTVAAVDPWVASAAMMAADPEAFGYCVPVPAHRPGGERFLVGASPELLVARRGNEVSAHPLAGSRARVVDRAGDARRGAELLGSVKDLAEHAVVADAVRDVLGPLCQDLVAPAVPALHRTATLWHLGTRFRGTLDEPLPSVLDLLAALHPTPAVCGAPRSVARETITELEGVDRGWFTGAVGWCDAAGNGEWAVTIRSAEVEGAEVRLFAGAGVVAESDPASELAETAAKFRTVTRALGLADDLV